VRFGAHQVTSRHLGAAYPFAAGRGSGAGGVVIGRDGAGAVYAHDPFVAYARGQVTSPNMAVFGQVGRGKSALVKSYLWRQAVFGRRAWVIDPKGEYQPLAEHWGVRPIELRPGGRVRLNPLEVAASDAEPEEQVRQRAELLAALAAAGLGRPLLPSERAAVDLAVAAVGSGPSAPTVPAVVDALLAPSAGSAASVRTDVGTLAHDGRQVGLELRRLVAGDLRGMFDGPTSPGVDLGGSLVVLDLSALHHSPALGVVMTCAAAWLHGHVGVGRRHRAVGLAGEDPGPGAATGTLLVVDEAWAVLRDPAVARWLQSSWKLARAWGVANIAVLHRVSDLGLGQADSEHRQLVLGLLADSESRVVYAQAPGEMAEAARLLDLTSTEANLVPRLGRGVALWKVGRRSAVVRHVLAPRERPFVGTDDQMVAAAGRLPGVAR
jgi:hypothetical protein